MHGGQPAGRNWQLTLQEMLDEAGFKEVENVQSVYHLPAGSPKVELTRGRMVRPGEPLAKP